ncbi:hypothetical protein LR48_Vigan07g193600 [Vigna angularis]|uniref:Uncharacterized protein n=1 Tax=Phaseolus angularis TaxID=3914 RepID=A0A0L9V048_PHAAN|nr:hypothetical protein LR48_Vigan07g193600 [Vigna angularis]
MCHLWSEEQAVAVGGEKSQIYRSAGPASTPKDPSSMPNVHNKFRKLTRNVSKADASSRIRAWGSVVRKLTQLYPRGQLPERETSLLLRTTSLPRPVAVAHVGGSRALYDGSAATFATLR